MGIRTHRGRAAVYRRFWGAPMRSPRHLAVFALIVAALLLAIGFLLPKTFSKGPEQIAAAPSATATTTPDAAAGPTETRLPSDPLTPSSAPVDPGAVAVATQWAQAWVNHPKGTKQQEWIDGLRPLTDKEYLGELSTVDLRNVESTEVDGEAEAIESHPKSAVVDVPTDGPTLRLTVVDGDDGWRVVKHDMGV